MPSIKSVTWVDPPPDLAPIVNSVWRWDGSLGDGSLADGSLAPEFPAYLPGVGVECFFHHGEPPRLGDRRLPRAYVVMNTSRTLMFEADTPLRFTALRIRAGRLQRLLPDGTLRSSSDIVSPATLWGETGEILARRMATEAPLERQASQLFDFVRSLAGRSATGESGTQRFETALDALYYAPNLRIETLAERLGWSRRSLERRFVADLGVSPKRFARLARMQHVFRRIALSPQERLLDGALDLGYYDHAHFIHEVEDLTGHTPGAILALWRGKPTVYNHPSRPPVSIWDTDGLLESAMGGGIRR